MNNGVSVIICSYNGAKRLPQTLLHLARQKINATVPLEVILVDNNSNDNTADVAKEEWQKYNLTIPLIVLRQPTPGVSYAREKGLKASRYSYIIQCDDDNWLAEDYIEKVVELFEQNIKIGMVGGQSTGYFETEPPVWFEKFSTAYAIGKRRNESTSINWLASAGVAIRKEALERLNNLKFEHILSGRKGKRLIAGDDLELCAAVRAIGYDIYYSTALNFVHFMPANRLTWAYFKNMVKGQASAQSVFDMYSIADILIKGKKQLSFNIIYQKLIAQNFGPLKTKCSSFKKSIRVIRSLLSFKEGDSYKYQNEQLLNYLKYLLLNRPELKYRYKQIEAFYLRANQSNKV